MRQNQAIDPREGTAASCMMRHSGIPRVFRVEVDPYGFRSVGDQLLQMLKPMGDDVPELFDPGENMKMIPKIRPRRQLKRSQMGVKSYQWR